MQNKKIIYSTVLAALILLSPFLALKTYRLGLWRLNYVSMQDFPVQGLDVSHHQGDIRWDEVPKERFRFVYVKATEGGDHKDRKFPENWRQAKLSGFDVGGYHFFTLCRPAADQVRNFIETVPVENNSLPPAVDLEFGGNCSRRPPKEEFERDLRAYIQAIETHYKTQPILYATYEFWDAYLKNTEFADDPLWIRDVWHHPVRTDTAHWYIWQYAANARIKGIDTIVDLNAKR